MDDHTLFSYEKQAAFDKLYKRTAKYFGISSDNPLLCDMRYGMLMEREKDTCLFREDNE